MIKVEGLTRKYGSFVAVDDISFVCKPGTVTGFLGPNGAGKTTTMRVMIGLTPATAGDVTIGGLHFHDIPNPGRHVGVLLDASAQHAGRTGREVLTIGAKTMGLPVSRVDEMLALVALDDTESKRRIRNYSLGMRQRLGIAHALLGDPSVLILDEPANGLDPAGIRWMRGLFEWVRRSRRHGAAVQPPAARGRADRRRDAAHRPRQDRGPRHQGRAARQRRWHRHPGRRGGQRATLRRLDGEGRGASRPSGSASASTRCRSRSAGSPSRSLSCSSDLRPVEGGLEDLFLELTSDTQRDDLAHAPVVHEGASA